MSYHVVPHDTRTKELIAAEILEALRDIAHDWMMFGTHLGIPYHKLQEIGGPTNVGTCMLATLNEWISLKPQEATIHNLISAIRGPVIENNLLAQHIEGDSTIKEMFELDKGTYWHICDCAPCHCVYQFQNTCSMY